jgi:hypothetical protein
MQDTLGQRIHIGDEVLYGRGSSAKCRASFKPYTVCKICNKQIAIQKENYAPRYVYPREVVIVSVLLNLKQLRKNLTFTQIMAISTLQRMINLIQAGEEIITINPLRKVNSFTLLLKITTRMHNILKLITL